MTDFNTVAIIREVHLRQDERLIIIAPYDYRLDISSNHHIAGNRVYSGA